MQSAKNTRRDASLSPHKNFKKRNGHKLLLTSFIVFLLTIAIIGIVFTENHQHHWYFRHMINVDGNPSDWTGVFTIAAR